MLYRNTIKTNIYHAVKIGHRGMLAAALEASDFFSRAFGFKIHPRGVQWKQGVLVYMILYAVPLYNTTPMHCTPLRLHPPLMNTHSCPVFDQGSSGFHWPRTMRTDEIETLES